MNAVSTAFAFLCSTKFFMSGILSILWNIFNTLQLIMGTELLAILMPANIVYCFEMLSDTVNFQLLPKEDLYDSLIAGPFSLETY